MDKKVIFRAKGGLGNQLFCYAAARRLAFVNGAELVVDAHSGFARDFTYKRHFALDRFDIQARVASPLERFAGFERIRRAAARAYSARRPFAQRSYIEQEGVDFDARLLEYKVRGSVYLDGLWQGEGYFRDVQEIIRRDLRVRSPLDAESLAMAREMRSTASVALHVRWFDSPGASGNHNAAIGYYRRATAVMEGELARPRYYVFSDDLDAVRARIDLPEDRTVFVSHNRGDDRAFADLWLMSQCRHFIIANSTFSWWGAWLAEAGGKIICAPGMKVEGKTAWGFAGLIPTEWRVL